MRRFSADYLTETRRGMWESREALADLSLSDRDLVLDVGCGTGELSAVLVDESPGRVVGVDRDSELLATVPKGVESLRGDACSLPIADGAADLVVCQALLINLPDPGRAIEEFRRASGDLVAAIEPDNGAVAVESTVAAEARLAARARDRYVDGVETDVTLGAVPGPFRTAGLTDVRTCRYDHERIVEPPYSDAAVESARRKASGARLREQRETLLAGGMDEATYDALRRDWRAMGRSVADQMADGTYRRREVVPFHVTVGRLPEREGSGGAASENG